MPKISVDNWIKSIFASGSDFFEEKSILSDEDIQCLSAYNTELKKVIGYKVEEGKITDITTSKQTAWNRTMLHASDAAKKMVEAVDGAAVDLENIPKVSKAGELALKGLAIAGNMLASWAISEGIKLLYDCATASDRLKKSASELSETFASDKADIEGYKDTPNCRPSNLPIPFFPVLFPSISANFRTSPRKKSYKLIPIRDSEYDSAVSFILQKIRQEAVSNK